MNFTEWTQSHPKLADDFDACAIERRRAARTLWDFLAPAIRLAYLEGYNDNACAGRTQDTPFRRNEAWLQSMARLTITATATANPNSNSSEGD